MVDSSVPEPEADDPALMAGWPTGRLLSTAARLLEHAWFDALESLGLSYAGLIVLHLIAGAPASQAELARGARVEEQTMSRTLARLERQGYVARRPDPADRRRRVVTRTEAGADAWREARRLEAELFPEIAEPTVFRGVLLDIIAAAEDRRWSGRDA